MALKLPHHAGDDLEAQTRARLIDIEPFGQTGAMVGGFDVKMPIDFPGCDVDLATTFWISILDRVGNQLVDQKSQRNCVVC